LIEMPGAAGGALTVSVRRARESDAEGICGCLRSAFEPYRASYAAGGFEDTVLAPGSIRRRFDVMSVFVASDESGEVVGTIGAAVIAPSEGHIRGMAVRPAWQGRGVAKQLLEAAESALAVKGCSRISLDTTEPLKRAVAFYEKNGYRPSGKITDFFGMRLCEYAKTLR
jgi:GNAT superfamily N-acetyltransferase